MRVGVTGKLVVKMNIPVAVRNATTLVVSPRGNPGYVLAKVLAPCRPTPNMPHS